MQIKCVGEIRLLANEEEHQNSLQEEFNDCASKLKLLKNLIAEVGMNYTRNCTQVPPYAHIFQKCCQESPFFCH